jgi:hypothetical protein
MYTLISSLPHAQSGTAPQLPRLPRLTASNRRTIRSKYAGVPYAASLPGWLHFLHERNAYIPAGRCQEASVHPCGQAVSVSTGCVRVDCRPISRRVRSTACHPTPSIASAGGRPKHPRCAEAYTGPARSTKARADRREIRTRRHRGTCAIRPSVPGFFGY